MLNIAVHVTEASSNCSCWMGFIRPHVSAKYGTAVASVTTKRFGVHEIMAYLLFIVFTSAWMLCWSVIPCTSDLSCHARVERNTTVQVLKLLTWHLKERMQRMGHRGKRLRSENGNGVDSPEPVLESEQTFNGHKDGATCVTWLGPHTIASGSMDFTVSLSTLIQSNSTS